MIDLRSGRISDILPENLSSQLEVQAFGYALHRQIDKLLSMAEKVSFLTAIDRADEEILDYLAIELRTPCYKMEYSIEVKRALILSTLPYYMKMGTTYMVNSIIQTIFGNGHIIEFFEAGLEPHHFAVTVKGAEATTRPTAEFREVLEEVKRKSQWLDYILLEFDTMESTLHIGGCMGTSMTTPIAEQPDNIKFEGTERLGGPVGTITETPVTEQPDAIRFRGTERLGGRAGTISATRVVEQQDKYEFSQPARVGGRLGSVITTAISEEPDYIDFRGTLNTGGELNSIQSTPLHENQGG